MAALEKFLEWFHDGREDEYDKILKVFGTTRRFLQAVIKYGEQDQIDIAYIPHKEWVNDPELFDLIVENGILDSNDIDYDNVGNNSQSFILNMMAIVLAVSSIIT